MLITTEPSGTSSDFLAHVKNPKGIQFIVIYRYREKAANPHF